MSENKHTAEPWAVKGAAIRTADGIGIDVIATMQVSNQPFWDEDARRIVACVNACRGIPDDVLQVVGAFGGFGRDQMVEHVTKQRDELLTALERCRFALEPYDDIKPRDWKSDRLNLREAHQAAVAAIASVKGEQ